MVNAHRAFGRTILKNVLPGWLHRPFAAVGRDMQKWWALALRRSFFRPGLFTYILYPPGGVRRIHLRINDDGSGVLLVNAADAIHLNASAAFIVKLALEGRTRNQAVSAINGRFGGLGNSALRTHVEEMYALVHHLSTTADACVTCGLSADRAPFFTVPVAAPYKADLALTYGCNNACRHCYNRVQHSADCSKKSPLPLGEGQGEGEPESVPAKKGTVPFSLTRKLGQSLIKSPLPTNLRSVPGEGQGEGEPESVPAKKGTVPFSLTRKLGQSLKNSPLPTNLRSVPGEGQGEGMSVRQWRKVLRKLARIGVPHVIFTGGEPTLHPGLCELIRAAERLGLITGLNTNGRQLADRTYTDSLVRAGLSHAQITLQSCRSEVHNAMTAADSFAETCRGITNALAADLHVITNTTLTRRNVDHALETVDFLHRLGLKTFAMNGMIFSGRGLQSGDAVGLEHLRCVLPTVRDRAKTLGMCFLWYTPTDYCRLSPLELELGPRRCNAGEYSMCIEPNGDVLPCQSYYISAGNILSDPWQNIWEGELFRGFRDRVRDPRSCGLPERCWRCPDLPVCGGGCRLERMKDETGRMKELE
jgi:radical SAM protein with 4Fe4S-binding SPASM domain